MTNWRQILSWKVVLPEGVGPGFRVRFINSDNHKYIEPYVGRTGTILNGPFSPGFNSGPAYSVEIDGAENHKERHFAVWVTDVEPE